MPEGDSLWQQASLLHGFLAGKPLTGSDFRVPRFATLDLRGWRTLEVRARGKHLLHRLGAPAGTAREGLTIHSHLKMEGQWQLYRPGERWHRPGHTARCVLTVAEGSAVGFSLGVLEVVRTREEDAVVGHLGPDLLGEDWDPATAEANLRSDPARPLGLALLDQRIMAGVGNIYRNELCFLAGLHPAAPVAAPGAPPARLDAAGVVREAHRLLDLNRDNPRRQTTPPAPPGRPAAGGRWPEFFVYGRARQPCLRCRTPIRQESLGEENSGKERVVYFCTRCQPIP
ncbi:MULTISPECIES: DNA-formamidopyrimidine glycosylase family protein [Arthrobacter]|uniref:DNA-(apurinic or apyrimidinic site) lyase n=2 Tax=Arthrobacter TaxID=1663 RepID=A0ABU9KHL6_9MICC|nr:DNA-formamidopyrimidine glycosylase family protein [Arthrobacter sp. YJM1]MDP5226603.1 DNA-formamidopyrimidine glycosylase family protein [Arthrobacter sp. YJM1]